AQHGCGLTEKPRIWNVGAAPSQRPNGRGLAYPPTWALRGAFGKGCVEFAPLLFGCVRRCAGKEIKPNRHAAPDGANPQNEIHVDDDPVAFVQHHLEQLAELDNQFALALKQRFEAVDFTEVALCFDGTQWEFRASKIRKQDCQTTDQARAAVAAGLRELGHEVDGGLIVALVV